MPWDSGTGSIDQLVQGFSFSQPACPEHMLVNSQLLGTPGSSQVRGHLAPLGIPGCCLAVLGTRLGQADPLGISARGVWGAARHSGCTLQCLGAALWCLGCSFA